MRQLSNTLLALAAVQPQLVFEALDASIAADAAEYGLKGSDYHCTTAEEHAVRLSAAMNGDVVTIPSVVFFHDHYEDDVLLAADFDSGARIISIPLRGFGIARHADGSFGIVEIAE